MQESRILLASTLAVAMVPAALVFAQDTPSLGDAARQARQEKQKKEAPGKDAASKDAAGKDSAKDAASKDVPSKDAQPSKSAKVITNDEIPEHVGPAAHPGISSAAYAEAGRTQPASAGSEGRAEAVKSQIAGMKSYLASLQSQIDGLNDSIHFAPGNCVANCVQWNERQVQKQQQVEQMKAQLEDQKKRLEDMQESARQQGYGSSVYDP